MFNQLKNHIMKVLNYIFNIIFIVGIVFTLINLITKIEIFSISEIALHIYLIAICGVGLFTNWFIGNTKIN